MGMLDGKVALITGAGSGIGRAVARRFAVDGAKVAALDISRDRLVALQDLLGVDTLLPVEGDVREFESNREAVAQAVAKFGGLDILVGNAGIFDGFRSLGQGPRHQSPPAYNSAGRSELCHLDRSV